MSSELAVVDQSEVTALLKSLGTIDEGNITVPFLNTLYKPDDKQGRDVNKHRGGFYLSNQENPIYAKTVKARFLCQHFQYRVTNPETFKTDNKTVLMENLSSAFEPRDMKGGIRCGRPDPKTWKNMDPEQKKKYSHIKAYRILRGIVSYTGETADGDTVEVVNEPFQLWHKGVNFMGFSRQVEQVLGKKPFFDKWVDMSNTKDGMAYVTSFALDFKTPAPMDEDVVATLRTFLEMVQQENAMINSAYQNANRPDDYADAIDAVAEYLPEDDDLEADFA